MKKGLLIIGTLLTIQCCIAQNDTPPYKRNPVIPQLTLLQPDSTNITNDQFKHQPTIIMYFSPTCDHCIHQWDDMVKRMDDLKKYQIVMVTYQPFEEMTDFYKNRNIASYSNVKMGRDTKFVLPPFYQIRQLPYLALYDKKGQLITTFESNVAVDKLVEAFKEKK
jgi:thioredoxin-related protein